MATLTYVYAESLAVVAPLSDSDGPHSWDLCEAHAQRITAPRNWDLVKKWAPAEAEPLPADALSVANDEPRAHLRAVPASPLESPVV